uniref:Reverse transcriptase domain-containing protein n=1 Tax=Dendroctonus ponderosae TaxID=77166 RepID=A0AAR5Q9X3_DENPD
MILVDDTSTIYTLAFADGQEVIAQDESLGKNMIEHVPGPTPEESTTLDTAGQKKERRTTEKLERGYRRKGLEERTGRRDLEKPKRLDIVYQKTDNIGTTPSQLTNAVIIIMHKKGDVTDLRNYRPISLLSHVYKLLMAVITKRLTNKLDSYYQPCEQAGFRSGYSTNNHLQVIKYLIEKCVEYNKPLVLIFVDYKKAFDTVDQHKMLLALADCPIYHRYIALRKNVYDTAAAHVRHHANADKFYINRGIPQGDPVIDWDDMGISVNGENLNHLRFADDAVLISGRIDKARASLGKLHQASGQVGLKINISKTQFMTNQVVSTNIPLGDKEVQVTS